ncbi:serine hydrolase domain-containing protein [Shinella sp. M27]|uniref:serine hydrolase domain-containing protein n=1 Tax=Shinella sp. M27 TaxID=3368614 RepID=UPI003BA01690
MTPATTASANVRPKDLTLSNWDRPPFNRWSFQHVRDIVPTAPVARGLPQALLHTSQDFDLARFTFADSGGTQITAQSLLDRSYTDGFLVLHGGKIVCEHYHNGMQSHTLHLTQSVSKSVVAALAGILDARGDFPLERSVAAYVPQFSGSAYHDVTMRHLLDMTSGVHFPEDIADPETGFGLMDIAVGWKPAPATNTSPRSVRALIASMGQIVRPHGLQFEYRSMETEVLGYCIEAATGAKLPTLVSELIWQPMGAECDASFGIDAEGFAIADGGLSASLRDLGRFGLIYAQNGYANGRQIVPEAWVRETRIGDPSLFTTAQKASRPNGAYRNKFWIEDVEKSAIMALGIFGQIVYIDHARDFVGVKLSSWATALDVPMRKDVQNLMGAMASSLT